jgi:hypothetical protein
VAVQKNGEILKKLVVLYILLIFINIHIFGQVTVNPDSIYVDIYPDEQTVVDLSIGNPTSNYAVFTIEVNYISGESWIVLGLNYPTVMGPYSACIKHIPISSSGLSDVTCEAELIVSSGGVDNIVPVTLHVYSTTEHNPPSNAGYEIIEDHIHLFWEPPVNTTLNVLEYHIYVDGVMFTTIELYYDIYDLFNGQNYEIGLTALYEDGIESDPIIFDICFLESSNNTVSLSPALMNYPNPFNPSTTIEFSIQNDSDIALLMFNVKGQRIKTLAKKHFSQGSHKIIWIGDDNLGKSVSSGIYYYKLNVNGKTEAVRKCLLLK